MDALSADERLPVSVGKPWVDANCFLPTSRQRGYFLRCMTLPRTEASFRPRSSAVPRQGVLTVLSPDRQGATPVRKRW